MNPAKNLGCRGVVERGGGKGTNRWVAGSESHGDEVGVGWEGRKRGKGCKANQVNLFVERKKNATYR